MATQITHPAEQLESIDTSRFECIDGQLVERPVPTTKHSGIVTQLVLLIHPLVTPLGMKCGAEPSLDRIPGARSDWMTPDFAVAMSGGYINNQNGHALPPLFLVAEVLSPEQSFENMRGKVDRYLAWGVKHVWLIDPFDERAWIGENGMVYKPAFFAAGEFIRIPLAAVFL